MIQCHCILPQYRGVKNPVFHKFLVFSTIDTESDTVIPKFTACNNCGAAHKVFDIAKSEIITGRDEVPTAMSIDDYTMSLPRGACLIFYNHINRRIADFEHAQFIIESNLWGDHIVLTREELDEFIQGKLVKFMSKDHLK